MAKTSFTLQRVLIAAALGIAFIGMASVFSPDQSRAISGDPYPHNPPRSVEPVHPHAGLEASGAAAAPGVPRSLGSFLCKAYTIEVIAGADAPRYTVIDNSTGDTMAAQLTAAEFRQRFPELQLPQVDSDGDGRENPSLMMVDPDTGEFD